jgi:tetratricopeptide (TPR) repeat protein
MAHGIILQASGRRREAVEQALRAVRVDPLQTTARCVLGSLLASVGRFAEAEEHFQQAIRLDPNLFLAYGWFSGMQAGRGLFAEVLPLAEKAFALAPWNAAVVGVYAGALARTGHPERSQELIQKLAARPSGADLGWALFHTCCGEVDLAADWFEQCLEKRNVQAPNSIQNLIGEPVRASHRWPKLAAMMNLSAGPLSCWIEC